MVDADGADAIGDEPLFHKGEVVGWATSGGYGHTVDKSIALGYLPSEMAEPGAAFEIEILGDMRPATLAEGALHDPQGTLMRS